MRKGDAAKPMTAKAVIDPNRHPLLHAAIVRSLRAHPVTISGLVRKAMTMLGQPVVETRSKALYPPPSDGCGPLNVDIDRKNAAVFEKLARRMHLSGGQLLRHLLCVAVGLPTDLKELDVRPQGRRSKSRAPGLAKTAKPVTDAAPVIQPAPIRQPASAPTIQRPECAPNYMGRCCTSTGCCAIADAWRAEA